MSKALVPYIAVATLLFGCNVGAQYSGSPTLAFAPRKVNLAAVVQGFLRKEFARLGCSDADVRPLAPADDDSVSYQITNLKGCVIKDGGMWEEIDAHFLMTGGRYPKIAVTLQGRYATGFSRRNRFENMIPTYETQLDRLQRVLLDDFSKHLTEADLIPK